ncbi:MAG: hypothetical protein AAGI54_08700 [Planctomycetota bacterium]
MNAPHLPRYQRLIAHLAGQALDLAEPHADPAEPGSLAIALLAARRLLNPDVPGKARAPSAEPLRDSHGHTRPAYRWLAAHLARQAGATPALDTLDTPHDDAIEVRCLAAACIDAPAADLIPELEDHATAPTPLHPYVDGDELIDVWWYRELAAIHGLANLVAHAAPHKQDRLRSAVLYHLDNTQPDHTTAQPWGVAAFAFFPEAIPFADQQLHDAQANWTASGPAAALLPGLILADAAHTLARLTQRDPLPA